MTLKEHKDQCIKAYTDYKDEYDSGIYIRVNDKNYALEDTPSTDYYEFINGLDKEGLIRTIDLLVALSQRKDDLVRYLIDNNNPHIPSPTETMGYVTQTWGDN